MFTRISRRGGGGVDLWHGCFLVKMYAKTKELGPVGGACARHAPRRSANVYVQDVCSIFVDGYWLIEW